MYNKEVTNMEKKEKKQRQENQQFAGHAFRSWNRLAMFGEKEAD